MSFSLNTGISSSHRENFYPGDTFTLYANYFASYIPYGTKIDMYWLVNGKWKQYGSNTSTSDYYGYFYASWSFSNAKPITWWVDDGDLGKRVDKVKAYISTGYWAESFIEWSNIEVYAKLKKDNTPLKDIHIIDVLVSGTYENLLTDSNGYASFKVRNEYGSYNIIGDSIQAFKYRCIENCGSHYTPSLGTGNQTINIYLDEHRFPSVPTCSKDLTVYIGSTLTAYKSLVWKFRDVDFVSRTIWIDALYEGNVAKSELLKEGDTLTFDMPYDTNQHQSIKINTVHLGAESSIVKVDACAWSDIPYFPSPGSETVINEPGHYQGWFAAVCTDNRWYSPYAYVPPDKWTVTSCGSASIGGHGGCSGCIMVLIDLVYKPCDEFKANMTISA